MKAPPQAQNFLPYSKHFLDEKDIQCVVNVLRNSPITQGPTLLAFEKAVARYVGAQYAVAVSSGTAALHLATMAVGVKPGDTVVTSANTFVASANCAWYAGARPAFCDIDARTLNINAALLEKASRTLTRIKAVIPVHFAGLPCEMSDIHVVAEKLGAIVIEDGAHALGAKYSNGHRVGSCLYSAMTIFSFHPAKAMTTGEGGMITTNDETLYRTLLRLRTHGITKESKELTNVQDALTDETPNPWYYEMQELGFNYRMTDFQAALGLSQLEKIENFLNRRRQIAQYYDDAFAGMRDVVIPQQFGRSLNASHLYILRIPFGRAALTRMKFMRMLHKAGIGSQVHYLPVYWHPYYLKNGFTKGLCPEAEAYYSEAISLPMYFGLTDTDRQRVIDAVKGLLLV